MGVNRKVKLHNYNKKRLHLVPEDVDHEWQKKRKDLLLNHNGLELENDEMPVEEALKSTKLSTHK